MPRSTVETESWVVLPAEWELKLHLLGRSYANREDAEEGKRKLKRYNRAAFRVVHVRHIASEVDPEGA